MRDLKKPIGTILVLAVLGGGSYFLVKKATFFLEPARSESPEVVKKAHPVKPENFRERFGNTQKSPEEEPFTFFETLNDTSLEKFVGLDGKVHSKGTPATAAATVSDAKESVSSLSAVSHTSEPKVSASPAVGATPAPKTSASSHPQASVGASDPGKPKDTAKSVRQLLDELSDVPGFAVQVSSFREIEKAVALKDYLAKKGYPVFLATARLAEGGGSWHRVMLGRYKDWETANQAAAKARSEEKLNAVVIREDGA